MMVEKDGNTRDDEIILEGERNDNHLIFPSDSWTVLSVYTIPPQPDIVPIRRVLEAMNTTVTESSPLLMDDSQDTAASVNSAETVDIVEESTRKVFGGQDRVDYHSGKNTPTEATSLASLSALEGLINWRDTNLAPVDSITCQVRLSVPVPANTCSLSTTIPPRPVHWILEALNVHGEATTTLLLQRIPVSSPLPSYQFSSDPTTSNDCETIGIQQFDEFYLVYHTHAHSIRGNRPRAVAVCYPCTPSLDEVSSISSPDPSTLKTTGSDVNQNAAKSTNQNNVYTIEWVSSPMNYVLPSSSVTSEAIGHVSIHFQYTAGIGSIAPPHKNQWKNGGYTQTCYLQKQVLPSPLSSPYLRIFAPQPIQQLPAGAEVSNGSDKCPPPAPAMKLSDYDLVVAVGDSILEQFVTATSTPNIQFGPKVSMPLSRRNVLSFLRTLENAHGATLRGDEPANSNNDADDPFNQYCEDYQGPPTILSKENGGTRSSDGAPFHGDDVSPATTSGNRPPRTIALILNSALWDVLSDEATGTTALQENSSSVNTGKSVPTNRNELDQGATVEKGDLSNSISSFDPWEDHCLALSDYVSTVMRLYCHNENAISMSEMKSSTSPNRRPVVVHLYWFLPTAVHIHRVHLADDERMYQRAPQKINRTRYMSASRTLQLYHRQKHVLRQLVDASSTRSSFGRCNPGSVRPDEPRPLQPSPMLCLIDVYEATYLSADWTLPGDGRHYRSELNQRMLSWYL